VNSTTIETLLRVNCGGLDFAFATTFGHMEGGLDSLGEGAEKNLRKEQVSAGGGKFLEKLRGEKNVARLGLRVKLAAVEGHL